MSEEQRAGQAQQAGPGLFASLRRMGLHGLELLQNRVELVSIELEAEKLRLFAALVQALMALLLAIAGLGLFSAGLLLLSPEAWRWLCALLMAAAYFSLAWWCWKKASRSLSQQGGAFAGTVAELARDRAELGD